MFTTPEDMQAKAQFDYDSISARVDSVKRKLDGGSSTVTYELLSTLLDEQKKFKQCLDDANDFAAQSKPVVRSKEAREAEEDERVKTERRELKAMLNA